jgi:hypothetical protein
MKPLAIFIAILLNSAGIIEPRDIPKNMDYGIWKMVKNADGVQSFVRWTTTIEGVRARERKGEMTVNCTLQDAVRLLSDGGSTAKWMSGVDENYVLARINATEWYTYTLFSIPWPFNKRDLVSYCRLVSDPSHGVANIAVVCKDKYVPLKPGITRLTDYRATWVITRLDEKNVRICFSAISTARPILPRPVQDPVIESAFHNNLVHLREILSS